MDSLPANASATSPNEETNVQKQARLRRERREAKIKAGGSSRLQQISNLSGRPSEPALPIGIARPLQSGSVTHTLSEDPEEVDISNHHFATRTSSSSQFTDNGPTRADIRHLFSGNLPSSDTAYGQQDIPGQEPQKDIGGGDQDPMIKMLQQIIGDRSDKTGNEQDGNGNLPPELAAMLGGDVRGSTSTSQDDSYDILWRIAHAIFALSLGIYTVAITSFTGSRLSRSAILEGENASIRFFWIFATAELVLQSSRFFLERGKPSKGGILGMVAGLLPQPWKGYIELISRHRGIYSTILEDATGIVFVLGVVAWWQKLVD